MTRRFSVALAGLLLLASVGVAQNIRVTPPRPGGDPLTLSSTGFPLTTGSPVIDAPQYVSLTINAAQSATSGNLTVVSSSFVRLRNLGCTTNDGSNNPSISVARIFLTVVDATHVTWTATAGASVGGTTMICNAMVQSLPNFAVNSIQTAINMTANASTVITAVTVGKTEIENWGEVTATVTNANESQARVTLVDSTHVGCAVIDGAAGCSAQIIEWK